MRRSSDGPSARQGQYESPTTRIFIFRSPARYLGQPRDGGDGSAGGHHLSGWRSTRPTEPTRGGPCNCRSAPGLGVAEHGKIVPTQPRPCQESKAGHEGSHEVGIAGWIWKHLANSTRRLEVGWATRERRGRADIVEEVLDQTLGLQISGLAEVGLELTEGRGRNTSSCAVSRAYPRTG